MPHLASVGLQYKAPPPTGAIIDADLLHLYLEIVPCQEKVSSVNIMRKLELMEVDAVDVGLLVERMHHGIY